MAIEITKQNGYSYEDKFATKCKYCGCEFTYTRADAKMKCGILLCPGNCCGKPIYTNEDDRIGG
jgi:hypothetical protein